jgi:hypothetical protein
MKRFAVVISALVVLVGVGLYVRPRLAVQAGPQTGQASSATALTPDALDRLLAPIALYPDQLLAQMLMCAGDPGGVKALDQFLKSNSSLKGTELQDAAVRDNFEPQFVAMVLFPQVVSTMATQIESTTRIGQAFATDKTAVFASIQRLRKQAKDAGNLKTTQQQEVETKSTSAGQEVIVIEPANPQVIYVPQYNTQTVYVQQPASTTVVVQDNSADAAVAGVIGFTAGIAIGAAMNNNYYYGPYGWHGGAYMYNDAWNDYYDHREDAREDWMDHREDLSENRNERLENTSEQRTERQENRSENRPESQQQRTERQENRPESQAQRQQQRTNSQAASTSSAASRGSGSYESRGYSQGQSRTTTTQQRSGTSSGAFSGYSSGQSERAASTRGQSSRSSSGGGRSRSGGGGRRR